VSAPITRQWGSIRNQAREQATKVLLEGLGGVKEIKLFGREDVFLAEHARHQVRSQRVTYLFATFQQFPRSVFEILAFMGMGAMIAVLILVGKPAADAVGVLAVFAAAAFRILPSLSRVTTSFQYLSFGRAMVFSVYDDLIEEPNLTTPREFLTKTQFKSLTLENVTFVYDAASRPALENLSISIGSGEYVGVIGSSGAGKSTLIDVLLGLLEVSRGKVLLNGQPIKDDIAQWRGIVGYVPQDIYLLDDTIRRNIALDIRDAEIDDESVETALRAAQLWEFVQSLPEGLETETGERGVRLSGGQRQRLGIARALYRRPQVLVFDEATSALDSQTEQEVIEAIEQLRGERTVIVVAHRLSTVRMCDRLYLLESGRVVNSGTYEQVLGSS
jgi:ATP-binding cassette subfamily C protein